MLDTRQKAAAHAADVPASGGGPDSSIAREALPSGPHRPIAVVDLFCGTSGFSTGFSRFNPRYELAGAVDIDGDAAQTAKKNHPKAYVTNDDLLKLSPRKFGKLMPSTEVGLIIGGPPCQGFSSLRPFRSADFDDPRNSLFEQFAAFVAYFRPKIFVLENVVGILTHKEGRTAAALMECFTSLGYSCDWKVLNAANFGVPQKRERFILIGSSSDEIPTFPLPTHAFDGRVIGFRDPTKVMRASRELPKAISVMEAIGDLPPVASGETASSYISLPQNAFQAARRARSTTLSLHQAPNHSEKILEIIRHSGSSIACIPPHLITSGFSSSYSRLDGDAPANTMTVKFQSAASSRCIHPVQNRALTLREGARLQSFDDDFLFAGSATSIASQIGNAVPPLLGTAIAQAVSDLLEA